jgi:hypothetical protein
MNEILFWEDFWLPGEIFVEQENGLFLYYYCTGRCNKFLLAKKYSVRRLPVIIQGKVNL